MQSTILDSKCVSMTFENALMTLMGLQLDTSSLEPFLYIGFTLASFALVGKIPLSIVAFITSVKGLHKIPADLETTLGGIKSFPAAFFGFKEAKICKYCPRLRQAC